MRVLLPPSETKRPGGDGAPLDLDALFGERLTAERRRTMRDLAALSRDRERGLAALHLSERAADQLDANRRLTRAPTLPALDRYDGVLYDALDAGSLTPDARQRAERTVLIQSALFGPIAGGDRIPPYRLSASTSLGGPSLRQRWRVAAKSWPRDELLIDLRSEDYRALTPATGALVVDVVSEDAAGVRRALNHWNKHAKGLLVRALVEQGGGGGYDGGGHGGGGEHGGRLNDGGGQGGGGQGDRGFESVDALLAWAADAGIRLLPGEPGRLVLVAHDPRTAA